MGQSDKKRSMSMVEDSDDSEAPSAPAVKKTKSTASEAHSATKDDDGKPYWEV